MRALLQWKQCLLEARKIVIIWLKHFAFLVYFLVFLCMNNNIFRGPSALFQTLKKTHLQIIKLAVMPLEYCSSKNSTFKVDRSLYRIKCSFYLLLMVRIHCMYPFKNVRKWVLIDLKILIFKVNILIYLLYTLLRKLNNL